MFYVILFYLFNAKPLTNGEKIPVFGSQAYPLLNPLEIYDYSIIPFSNIGEIKYLKKPSFLGKLIGKRFHEIPVLINFLQPVSDKHLYSLKVSPEVYETMITLIKRKFMGQLYIGKLPDVHQVGYISKNVSFIYTHIRFILHYNDNHVVEVKVTDEKPIPFQVNDEINFDYSVEWIKSNKKYRQRFDRYCDKKFSFNNIRKYSSINSIILTVATILMFFFVIFHYIGNDVILNIQSDDVLHEMEEDIQLDAGWRLIHGDVFRSPKNSGILSTLIAIGVQLFLIVFGIIISNEFFGLYMRYKSNVYLSVLLWVITSLTNGYFIGGLLKKWRNKGHWIPTLIFSATLIPIIYILYKFITSIFELKNPTNYSIVITLIVIFICALVISIFGGIIGRHFFCFGEDPTNIALIKRKIPPTPFYLKTFVLTLIIGYIESICVLSEMHFILSSIWNYKNLCSYFPLFIVFIAMITNSSLLTIIAVYFRLNEGNYEWQWMSFIAPFGISIYLFIYCISYYRNYMTYDGMAQMVYFLASSSLISVGVGAVCGAVGFISAYHFVRILYNNMKID